jgi:uncharacterized protein (DUF885 family)
MPRRSAVLPCAALLVACAAPAATGVPSPVTADAPRQVDALADEYFAAWVRSFPLSALLSGVPDAPNESLSDNSLAAVRVWQEREDRWLARLQQVPAEAVRGGPAEATYGVLLETLEAARQTRVCRAELWPLDQQGGWQITLPLVSQLQPLGTERLRAEALTRWRTMPRYIDNEIGNLREGLRAGYTQPRANAEAVLAQLDDILALRPEDSPFAGLAARDSAPGFGDSVVAIVGGQILPAVRRYRAFLASEYIPGTRTATALTALPQGADCYRALVRQYTTEDLDPLAVHQLGLRQMNALESEMRPIARGSFGTDDLPALFERLRTDGAFTFGSREEIIRTAQAAVARARAAMPKWFGRLPKADVIVDPCLPFEEKSGCPNSYVSGTPDGKRPGRWRINAGDTPPQPRAPLEGTAFHETIPGHHLQGSLAQERPDAHPIRRYFWFSGFGEGWALYAERLALDMDIYSSDLARFGELGEQALRAARLVVDPGLHVMGWSRQQALDYMVAHVPESHAVLESEVDRYISSPGQATSYMVGRLEIERLREEARTRLGSAFDIREFHDTVLESGCIPLPLLRAHMEAWLDGRAAQGRGR